MVTGEWVLVPLLGRGARGMVTLVTYAGLV